MNLIEAVRSCLRQYVDFTGRASRSEFWYFLLFNFILVLAVQFINILPFIENKQQVILLGDIILTLFFFLPGVAVSVRRLHDLNCSGFWFLLTLIPVAGPIGIHIFFMKKGTEGRNLFGDDPLLLYRQRKEKREQKEALFH